MALGNDPHAALTAFNRFGLGARPGDLALAGSDPRGYLEEELRRRDAGVIGAGALLSTPEALQTFFLDQHEKRMAREAAAMAPPQAATLEGKPQEGKPRDRKAEPGGPMPGRKSFGKRRWRASRRRFPRARG